MRKITSVEELDDLPVGSVVKEESGWVYPKQKDGWLGDNCCYIFDASDKIALPAEVLYDPRDEDKTRETILSFVYGIIGDRQNLTLTTLDGLPWVPEHWRAQVEREAAPLLERLGL